MMAADYRDSKVEPLQLLGWLRSALDAGEVIDVAEWNKAVKALEGTSAR